MQERVAKEEKDLAKGKRNLPYTQEDLEAHKEIYELVGKHIAECEVLAHIILSYFLVSPFPHLTPSRPHKCSLILAILGPG